MSGFATRMMPIFLGGMIFIVCIFAAKIAQAQFFEDSLFQEDLLGDDEALFLEDTDEGVTQEQDFTEGDKFVDESQVPEDIRGIDEKGRRFQLTLAGERDELLINIAWGVGTGLMIGGWYALINEGDNRETQRSLGLGMVLGSIMGTIVGSRTLFFPDAARPVGKTELPVDSTPSFLPLISLNKNDARIGFRMTF